MRQRSKARFYSALWLSYLNLRRGRFTEVPKDLDASRAEMPQQLKAHFWTPTRTPGADVVVYDVLPSLRDALANYGIEWDIAASADLPASAVDWLICFKAVPPREIAGVPRRVMLICDQAEVFWGALPSFDSVVATSSRPFAALVATRNPNTFFLHESEPAHYLSFGQANLDRSPASRGHVLLWHGGEYSQSALVSLRPVLEAFAAEREVVLHVISGRSQRRTERWGHLRVEVFPWSREQLLASAAQARLGLIPARAGLRSSYLKPASRVRCLQALGVPTIGDARVPDVCQFTASFGGPTAGSNRVWLATLQSLWDDAARLDRLARAGHHAVQVGFSTAHTAVQWIRFLSGLDSSGRPGRERRCDSAHTAPHAVPSTRVARRAPAGGQRTLAGCSERRQDSPGPGEPL